MTIGLSLPERGAELGRHAILTATPDLMAQALVPELLHRLFQRGMQPVAAVPYAFSAAEAAMLYEDRITHRTGESRLHSKWLTPRMFGGGASIVLVLRATRPSSSLQAELAAAKGRSRMGEHRPDDLRGMSRMVDRCFSLVHSPDDDHGFLHEAGLVLGPELVSAALDPAQPPLPPSVVEVLGDAGPLSPDDGLFDVLPRAVARAVALVACDPSAASRAPANALVQQLAALRRELAVRPPDAVQRDLWSAMASLAADVRALYDAECRAVEWGRSRLALHRALGRIDLLRVVVDACHQDRFVPQVSIALASAMARCDVPLGYWDEHRLHVIAAFHGGAPR